jgi:lipopolysaccharide transport system permease protein
MSTLAEDVREMVQEQREYRELLVQMTKRDLLLRYKQTVMGFGWAVFMPLVNTAVFSVIFTRVAPMNVGMPYPLFAFCGLLAWNFFASSLRFSVSSLTGNTSLVTKIYFPREIFPFSAILVCLVDFAVGSIVLIGLMVYYRVEVTPWVAAIPVVMAVQLAFTMGIGLLLAMANLFFRDVKYLFEVVVTVWMFATSVLYPMQAIGGRVARYAFLNPMTPIIDSFRSVLLHGQSPFTYEFAYAAVVSFLSLGVGWLLFHRTEFRFAENA